MNYLIQKVNALLKGCGFDYAVCGGYAIELFINKEIRSHGDIDLSAFWNERDKIIMFMQSLGWSVYELCGGGKAHHITDVANQIKNKRNIFCMTVECGIVSLTPTEEPDMYFVDFDHQGQRDLTFIEFLFNDAVNGNFLYARNHDISLPLEQAILTVEGVRYLAPEIVLLYKSTETEHEGYQLDFDLAIKAMTDTQKKWLYDALAMMNPNGHKWLDMMYKQNPCRLLSTAYWKKDYFTKPDNIEIIHEKDLCTNINGIIGVSRYFRLVHYPQKHYDNGLPDGYYYRTVNLPSEMPSVAGFINRCYPDYSLNADDVCKWTQFPVFNNDLWVFVYNEQYAEPVALGIADFDGEIGEGSLEWIQVLPEYRGQGLGTKLVLELLCRLKDKAAFVTVSGEVHNPTNPEMLYRKCGFSGDDVWCVIRNLGRVAK